MHDAGEEELGLATKYEFESDETYMLYELQSDVVIEHAEMPQFEFTDEKKSSWEAIWHEYELEAVNYWDDY